MYEFVSQVPTDSTRDYLAATLPVYVRCAVRHQGGRGCVASVSRGRDGKWFLTPHATVIALHPIVDPTPIVDLEIGDRFTIDEELYELREDKPLHNPYPYSLTREWYDSYNVDKRCADHMPIGRPEASGLVLSTKADCCECVHSL